MKNYQGNAVINYTSADIPWTRIIEHKYFDEASAEENVTIITKEIPDTWAREKYRITLLVMKVTGIFSKNITILQK